MKTQIELARKEIEQDVFLLIRHYELEAALNSKIVVASLNDTFEAHCFNAIRQELMFSVIQILARMTEPAGRRHKDRASFALVFHLLETEAESKPIIGEKKYREEFMAAVERIELLRPPLKSFRDVHISHNLVVETAPELKYKEVDEVYGLVRACYVAMEKVFGSFWSLEEIDRVEKAYAKAFADTCGGGHMLRARAPRGEEHSFKDGYAISKSSPWMGPQRES